MLKHLRARNEDRSLLQKGFTLVELLVVIVILGILAAVVVFAIGGTENDAKAKACQAEKATVETAIEAYKAQKNASPPNIAAMVPEYLKHTPSYVTGINPDGTANAPC